MTFLAICFFLLLGWLFLKSNTRRGITFVRSYYFLLCLDNGKAKEEANYLARKTFTRTSDPDYDRRLSKMAVSFSKENFNGKQLPVINAATLKGYIK